MFAGFKRFCNDIYLMIGYSPNYYWIINWIIISPALLLVCGFSTFQKYTQVYQTNMPNVFSSTSLSMFQFIIIFAGVTHTGVYYGDYVYEEEINNAGIFLVMLAIIPIVVCAFIEFGKRRGWLMVSHSIILTTFLKILCKTENIKH